MKQLYSSPPADGRVICFDEFGPLEVKPYKGRNWCPQKSPNRIPAQYNRVHGVRHLLAAYDLKEDKLYAHRKKRKRHKEVLEFLKYIRSAVPENEKIYLILDNFSPHKHKKIRKWAKENDVILVFTPTYASWLNRIECHFGPLRFFALRNSNYKDHKEMGSAIRKYIIWRNKNTQNEKIMEEQNKIIVA